MKLSVLLSVLKEYQIPSGISDSFCLEDIEVTGLCIDSRAVKKGEVFVCLMGGKFDSHTFATDALEKGAVAVITERYIRSLDRQIVVKDGRQALALLSSKFYGEPSKKMKVIGVTGTNGKTTTTNMLSAIIKAAGKKTGVIGTLGIYYDKKEIAPELTTPDPIFLQKILADMYFRGVEYVLMEVSAHALYYKKVDGVCFSACIFSNFTQDHLDFFSTMLEYKKAKLQLFTLERCPIAIVNSDDELSKEILSLRENDGGNGGIKTCLYGLKNPADGFAVITEENIKGTQFVLNINDQLAKIDLRLIGLHNVYNALSAAVCAMELGFCIRDIERGLNGLDRVKGRLEWIAAFNGADIFVDFAHTPDGLEKSLCALKAHCKGRLICVFGCGGNRDKSKRPLMGECVAKVADFSYLTSDNPRYEDPTQIIADIEKGFAKISSAYVAMPDRERAVSRAISELCDGDVLLVAGKGGEDYQERMGIKYAYNDEDFIKKIIKRK